MRCRGQGERLRAQLVLGGGGGALGFIPWAYRSPPPFGATVLLLERAEGMLAEFLLRTPAVSLETGGGYRENSRHVPPVIGMTGGGC